MSALAVATGDMSIGLVTTVMDPQQYPCRGIPQLYPGVLLRSTSAGGLGIAPRLGFYSTLPLLRAV